MRTEKKDEEDSKFIELGYNLYNEYSNDYYYLHIE